ncbi:glycosyltransferase family 4 protein [Patescibacteria group bacterium]|nr:glycosyltransferase family 4 protein [Patescibacteria group bacterium]
MLIGIDGNEANIEKRVGVNQYAFELLKNIYKLQEEWKNRHKVIVYLSSSPQKDLPKENSGWKYKIIPGQKLWVLTKLMPRLLFDKEKPDVFFTPNHYVPPISVIPRVCTIHDLGYLEFSGQFKKYDFWQLKYWTAISLYISKAIIAVSNSTKGDIVRHYPSVSDKIKVTQHGYDKSRFNINISDNDVRRVKNKYAIVGDYVLFISTLKPSKNIEGLLEAWKLVLKDFPKYQLVIAGKKGWLYESIFKKVKNLKLESKIIFTDFISEEDKPALISGAKVFTLPSFWEGFGMDALTSMACGTPVVVSDIAALREVTDKAGIFVDPYNVPDIARGVAKVLLMNETSYKLLVGKGMRQAEKFSWEDTARKTIKILEKVNTSKVGR